MSRRLRRVAGPTGTGCVPRQARIDHRDNPEKIEPMLAIEPTESRQPSEPAEPMDRIEPAEPIDRIDPLEPMLRIDPEEPAVRDEPTPLVCMGFILAAEGQVRLVKSISQLVSQVWPLSVEKACSQRGDAPVMPDQMYRARIGVPLWVSSP